MFSEILKQSSIDLGRHAGGLGQIEEIAARNILITNVVILPMSESNPLADSMMIENGKMKWVGMRED